MYPPVCGVCGKGKTILCKKCEKKLNKETIFGIDNYIDKYFEKHYYIFKYAEIVRELLIDYKFNEKSYLYQIFVEFFNNYEKRFLQMDFYDIIIPVPISRRREKKRGYNQSLLVAREIAKHLEAKVDINILVKQKKLFYRIASE